MAVSDVVDYRPRADPGEVQIEASFYKPPLSYAGDVGQVDVYVYTSDPEGLIDKPVIVLDGFDAANAREWDGMHELLSEQGLLLELLNDGYDVIFVNPVDGGDYVQRTAFALIDVIEWVNKLKKGGSKNVVVGPSMGGLVARYALAYMEKSGMDHDTALYVSWDAPHQGANIPVGNQYFIAFFARHPVLGVREWNRRRFGRLRDKKLREAKEGLQGSIEGKQTLDRVASRQLLLYHYGDQDPGIRPERAKLMAELDGLGYPRLTRNVAITNGGRSGQRQFEPGAQMVSWIDDKGARYRADCATWALGESNEPQNLFWCKEAEIFGRKASGKLRLGPGLLAIDSAPGSTIDTTGLIADNPNPSIWAFGKKRLPIGDIKGLVDSECHIPTLSALGVPLTPETLSNPIPADIETPFDAIYMPEHNQAHVEVTAENKEWVLSEVRSALTMPPTTLRWVVAGRGEIPKGAMPAGHEGYGDPPPALYVARAKYGGGVHPGKIRAEFGGAYIPYGMTDPFVPECEVLVGPLRWQDASGGQIPPNAFVAGQEADGTPLYVARARLEGGLQLGKTRKGWKTAHIPYNGKELESHDYEVLIA